MKSKRLILYLLAYKGWFLILTVYAMTQLNAYFNTGHYYGCARHWPLKSAPVLSSKLATWDGAHYLCLATHGYVRDSSSCAFYPLWPGLIRLGSFLTGGNVLVSGLILANMFSLLAWGLFHDFVEQRHGKEIANLSLLFLLAFPGAIFFQFVYTESLFLLLVLLFFRFLFQEKYRAAALAAFFLPLTKAVGVFCLAPFAFELWSKRRPWREYLWMAVPLAGYAAYFAVLWGFTGNPLEGFKAQQFYPNRPSIGNIVNVAGIAQSFLNIGSLHDSMDSLLDRLFFVMFVGSLYPIWRLNKTYFAYALFAGAVPGLSTWFFSYSRNVMMCFPLFIVLGQFFQGRERRWMAWYYVMLLAGLQVFFLVRYVNFNWAG